MTTDHENIKARRLIKEHLLKSFMAQHQMPPDMVVLINQLSEDGLYGRNTNQPGGDTVKNSNFLDGIKIWLSERSGQLAAVAAAISSVMVSIPPDWASVVLSVLPDGPLRICLGIGLALAVLLLPRWAKGKDEKTAAKDEADV